MPHDFLRVLDAVGRGLHDPLDAKTLALKEDDGMVHGSGQAVC